MRLGAANRPRRPAGSHVDALTSMPAQFLHVVQAFKETDEGVMALEPRNLQTAGLARAAAQVLSHTHAGVVAWSRRADPDVGEYGEPEEIIRLGVIPEWFDEGGGVD